MIVFLVRRRNEEQPLQAYLDDWQSPSVPTLQPLEYSEALNARVLPRATYVFCDVESLGGRYLDVAILLADRLQDVGMRVVNHPRHALGRRALLDELHTEGINPFRVHSLRDRSRVRYPVFLRYDRHHWQLSGLLADERQVERAIVGAVLRGRDPEDLLLVEFVDTSDEQGWFRKYGAYVIDGIVVPQHVMFSRRWVVKDDLPHTRWMTTEALDYVRTNPHAAQLASICSLAGISYGRVDYACVGDRVIVWEINTNPTVMARQVPASEDRVPERRRRFREGFEAALARLDSVDDEQPIAFAPVEGVSRMPQMHSVWRQRLKPVIAPAIAGIERAPQALVGPLRRQVLRWVDGV